MSRRLRVGMIGAGRMASLHLEILSKLEEVEVVAVANTPQGQERREELLRKFNIPKGYDDYSRMLEQEALEAIFIAPSVSKVYEIAKACLSSRIPSFIEKPPGLSSSETAELLEIAETHRGIHMVGLQRRFYSHILEGITIIRDHGALISIVVEAPERFTQIKAKPKFGSDVLAKWIFANGIHCVDMLPFLGGDIEDVISVNQHWEETIHPDSLHALLKFKNGAVGHYMSNWTSPGGWAVTLYGQGCRVDINPMEKGRVVYGDGRQEELPIGQLDVDFKPGLYAQDKFFVDVCLGRKNMGFPAATLREALASMKLAEMILDPSLAGGIKETHLNVQQWNLP